MLQSNFEEFTDEDWPKFREQIVAALREGTVEVTFVKKDGDTRIMTCTLNPQYLPAVNITEKTKTKKENLDVLSVYDLNAQGWRSFIIKNVKDVKIGL